MKYSIVNRPAVKQDIINITNYYKEINPDLARQFLLRLQEAKAYISRYPLSFQLKYQQVRTLMLKQFPYHIHYLIHQEKKQIIILAVIHAYKNPTDYSGR